MPIRYFGALLSAGARRCGLLGPVVTAAFLAGCAESPRARSYMEFMEDSYAREGALARCNRDRDATADDPECVNARRAASMIAAQADAELREQRAAESEALLVAARERAAREQQAVELAQEAARAEAEAQYESQWSGSTEVLESDPVAPVIEDDSTYDSLASTLGVVGPPRPATLPVTTAPAVQPPPVSTSMTPRAPTQPPAPSSVSPRAPESAPMSSAVAPRVLEPPPESRSGVLNAPDAMPLETTPQTDAAMPLLDHIEVPSEAAPELLYVELPPGPQAANDASSQ